LKLQLVKSAAGLLPVDELGLQKFKFLMFFSVNQFSKQA